MRLPIDLIPNTSPPRFRWRQVVNTPLGRQSVEQEGAVSASIEVALQELIVMTRTLLRENAELQGTVAAHEAKQEAPALPATPADTVQPAAAAITNRNKGRR